MAATDFIVPDQDFPVFSSLITDAHIRRQLQTLFSSHRGTTDLVEPAQITGDIYWGAGARDLSTQRNLTLRISTPTTGDVTFTVDCANQTTPTATTLSTVIARINAAYNTAAGTSGVVVAFSLDAVLHLKSPRATADSIVEFQTPASNDGTDAITGLLSKRGVTLPYSDQGALPPDGMTRAYAVDSETRGHEWRYRNLAAPLLLSLPFTGGNVTGLGVRNHLYLTITTSGATATKDVTLPVSSGATTVAAIAAAINAAFAATFTTPVASAVNSGTQLQVRAPEQGAAALVKLFDTVGGAPRLNDAGVALFGVRPGLSVLTEFDAEAAGTIHQFVPTSRAPFTEPGTDWVRVGSGIERYGGFGIWGAAVDSAAWLTSAGRFDGEVRVDRGTGISWVWNARGGGGTWVRGVPAALRHLRYVDGAEAYRLRVPRDYAPEPLADRTSGAANARYLTPPVISVGDVPELIDARDARWPFATSGQANTFAVYGSDARPLTRAGIAKDTFDRGSTAAGNLALSIDGVSWAQFESNGTGGVLGGMFKILGNQYAGVSSGDISGTRTYYALYNTPIQTVDLSTGVLTATADQQVTCALFLNEEDQTKGGGALEIGAGVVAAATSDGQYGLYAYVSRRGVLHYGAITGRALVEAGTLPVVPVGAAAGMILRMETHNVSGNTFSVRIYWPSATSSTHWVDETPIVDTTIAIAGGSGTYCGIIACNDSAAGTSVAPVIVQMDRFSARDAATPALPGLGEYSGARLRDTITTLAVGGAFNANPGVVNDATPEFPARFVAGYGLLVEMDSDGRAIRYSIDPDVPTDGGGGGPGGGTGSTLPGPKKPPPSADGSIPSWGGKLTLRADLNDSVLFHVDWMNTTKVADPRLTMAVVDLCWNPTYLATFNQRPQTGRGWGYSGVWESGLIYESIRQFASFNDAVFGRVDYPDPPTVSGVPGKFWSLVSMMDALLLTALSDQQSPNKADGLPAWLTGGTGRSDVRGLIISPYPHYTVNSTSRPPFLLDAVQTTADLPRKATGVWDTDQYPPSGLVCFVIADAAFYTYTSGSDSWAKVSSGSGGGGPSTYFTTFRFGGTDITPDIANDTLTVVAGTNISFQVDPVTDTVTLNVPNIPAADLEFTHVALKDQNNNSLGNLDAVANEDTFTIKAGSTRLILSKTGPKEVTIDAAQQGGGGVVTFWVNGALDGQGDGVNVANVNLPLGHDLEAFAGAAAGVSIRTPWEVYAPDALIYSRQSTFNVGIGGSTKTSAPFVFQTTDDGNAVRFISKGQIIAADAGQMSASYGRIVAQESASDLTRGAFAAMAKDATSAATMRLMARPSTGTPYQWLFKKAAATGGIDSHELEIIRIDPTGNSPRLLRLTQADPGGTFAGELIVGETGQVTNTILNGNLTVTGSINGGGGGGGGGGTYFDISGAGTMDQLVPVADGTIYAKYSVAEQGKLAGVTAGAQPNNLSDVDADLVKNVLLANANATGLHFHTDQLAAITTRENGTGPLTCKTLNFSAAFDTVQDGVDPNQVNLALLFGTGGGNPPTGNHVHGTSGYSKTPWATGLSGVKTLFTLARTGSLAANTPITLLGATVAGDPSGPSYPMPSAGFVSRISANFNLAGSSTAQDFRAYVLNATQHTSRLVTIASQDTDRYVEATYNSGSGLAFNANDQIVIAILPGSSTFDPGSVTVLVEYTSN